MSTRANENRAPDPAFLGLLRAVAGRPEDDAPILVAADWLDEHVKPEPIPDGAQGRMPGWFAKGWRRVAGSGRRVDFPDMEFDQRISERDDRLRSCRVMDHWGFLDVCGIPCLVSEPYLAHHPTELILAAVRAPAQLTGGFGLFQWESAWNPPRTLRLIWAPHPDTVPALSRYDRSIRRR